MEEGSRTIESVLDEIAEGIPEGFGGRKDGRGGAQVGAGNPDAPPGSFDYESADFSEVESTPGGQSQEPEGPSDVWVSDSEVEARVESQSRELAESPSLQWGHLQETILDSLIADEDDWDGPAITALAQRLRSSTSELQGIMESSPVDRWHTRRMEKLLELEQMRKRGFNWDRVEAAALSKLIGIVETKTLGIGELLQVARVANASTRRGFDPGGAPMVTPPSNNGNQQNLQVNLYGQPVPGGQNPEGLPGPGTIGTVTLQLTQRTLTQISRGKEIEGESSRLSESIEMLTAEDVPELAKMADGKGE